MASRALAGEWKKKTKKKISEGSMPYMFLVKYSLLLAFLYIAKLIMKYQLSEC